MVRVISVPTVPDGTAWIRWRNVISVLRHSVRIDKGIYGYGRKSIETVGCLSHDFDSGIFCASAEASGASHVEVEAREERIAEEEFAQSQVTMQNLKIKEQNEAAGRREN